MHRVSRLLVSGTMSRRKHIVISLLIVYHHVSALPPSLLTPSVAAASKLLGNTVYNYKGYGLSMGTMIAGWDEAKVRYSSSMLYVVFL